MLRRLLVVSTPLLFAPSWACSDSASPNNTQESTASSGAGGSGTSGPTGGSRDTSGGAAGAGTGGGPATGTGGGPSVNDCLRAAEPNGCNAPPSLGGCSVFPAEDPWNTVIADAPVDATWTERLMALVGNVRLHPDYGGDGLYGIPINVVPEAQPKVPVSFDEWPDESDPGPYPFPGPDSAAIEGGTATACEGDCHLLVLQQGTCMLYEGFACHHRGGWHCANGAVWDLKRLGAGQRPKGWTSADAAGLPLTPGILRWSEVRNGEVKHAIRFTVSCSRPQYVAPATHYAARCNGPNAPPMGLRVRLKTSFDLSGFAQNARVILIAMRKYGMILADNGSNFYFQGERTPDWPEDAIEPLKRVPASAFEVVGPVTLEP